MSKAPRVTIGLPTYNGARWLGSALESLLAQDYSDFELLVSNNGSTDTTGSIIQDYASHDSRMRVLTQRSNIGAAANFNLLFHESESPLFMWASDDDWWAPTYVSRCVKALENTPAAVLACSQLSFMDAEGESVALDPALFDNPDLSSPSVFRRVRRLASRGGWYQVYGLCRREALERTSLFVPVFGADVLLTLQLALSGPFVRVPERLFRYRHIEGDRDAGRGPASVESSSRVLDTPWTHLQESISATIAQSGLDVTTRFTLLAIAWATIYLTAAPMQRRVGREARRRLDFAVEDRDLVKAAKYGGLTAATGLLGPLAKR